MAEVDDVLAERGKVNGNYERMCDTINRLKLTMAASVNYGTPRLPPTHQEALDMIAHKMGRILTGNPNHEDHWRDIAGYATLVADRLKG